MNSDGSMLMVRRSSGMLHVLVCLCCVVWVRSEEENRTWDASGGELKSLGVGRESVIRDKSMVRNRTAGNGWVRQDDSFSRVDQRHAEHVSGQEQNTRHVSDRRQCTDRIDGVHRSTKDGKVVNGPSKSDHNPLCSPLKVNSSVLRAHSKSNCVLPDDRLKTGRSLKVGRITPSTKQKNEQPLHSSTSVLNRFVDTAHLQNDEVFRTTTINSVKEYTLNVLGILAREKKFTGTGYSCEGYLRITKDDVYRARSEDEQARRILLSVLRCTAQRSGVQLFNHKDHFMMKGTKEGYEKVEKVLHSLLRDLKNCLRSSTINGSGCIERKDMRREHVERSSRCTKKLVLGSDEEEPRDIVSEQIVEMTTEQVKDVPRDTVIEQIVEMTTEQVKDVPRDTVTEQIVEMTTEQAKNAPRDTVTGQIEGESHNMVTGQAKGEPRSTATEHVRDVPRDVMHSSTIIHALIPYAAHEEKRTATCDAYPTKSILPIDVSSYPLLKKYTKNLLDQCQQSNTTFMVFMFSLQQVNGQIMPKESLCRSNTVKKAEGDDPCVHCFMFRECAHNTASSCDLVPFIFRITCSGKICAGYLPQKYLQEMSIELVEGWHAHVENVREKKRSNGQCTEQEDAFLQELRIFLANGRNAGEQD